jgi:predicted SprT family Zn-dependent metalloprotease
MFIFNETKEVAFFIKEIVRLLSPMTKLFGVESDKITVLVKNGNGRSRGGDKNGPWMKIDGISRFMHRGVVNFVEYDHIQYRSDIGSYEGDAHKALAVLVAHELAHVIQYCGNKSEIDVLAKEFGGENCPRRNSGHGKDWQAIYATLRKVALEVADHAASKTNDMDLIEVKKDDAKKSFDVSVDEKLCSRCNTTKKANLFYKHIRSKDGLNAWCKICVADHKKFGKPV